MVRLKPTSCWQSLDVSGCWCQRLMRGTQMQACRLQQTAWLPHCLRHKLAVPLVTMASATSEPALCLSACSHWSGGASRGQLQPGCLSRHRRTAGKHRDPVLTVSHRRHSLPCCCQRTLPRTHLTVSTLRHLFQLLLQFTCCFLKPDMASSHLTCTRTACVPAPALQQFWTAWSCTCSGQQAPLHMADSCAETPGRRRAQQS